MATQTKKYLDQDGLRYFYGKLKGVINPKFESKQDKLTAGTNISIDGSTISCTLDTNLYVVVDSLESVVDPKNNKIYLVSSAETTNENKYIEYLYKGGVDKWEKLGEYHAAMDLSSYAKSADVERKITAAKSELSDRIDQNTTATSQIDSKISTAKQELQTAIDKKANTTDLEQAKTDLTQKLDGKVDTTDLTSKLAGKANTTDLDKTKQDIQEKLDGKANTTDLNQAKQDIQGKLDKKADKTEIASNSSKIEGLTSDVNTLKNTDVPKLKSQVSTININLDKKLNKTDIEPISNSEIDEIIK